DGRGPQRLVRPPRRGGGRQVRLEPGAVHRRRLRLPVRMVQRGRGLREIAGLRRNSKASGGVRRPRARVTFGAVTREDARRQASSVVKDVRWAAVKARDASADGAFFYSVRTTGVYCRPSCGARKARPENVTFHATAADAE